MIEGQLIVIEGIDGAGTTTQGALLAEWFQSRGLPVHLTHEPTDGPIGSMIRQVLTHRLVVNGITGTHAPAWDTMALLFAADRLDHLEVEIIPNLMDGVTVVSDRYDLSSIAYQTATAEPDDDGSVEKWVRMVNSRARRPDLTIVLDVNPDVASKRRRARAGTAQLFEDAILQNALAKAYTTAETLMTSDNLVHIDGDRSVQDVHAGVVAAVKQLRGDP